MSVLSAVQKRVVDVKPHELRALGLAFVFHFIVLGSYYVLRPIRDEIGAAGGLDNLPWMFSATLGAMLLANTLFAAIGLAGFLAMGILPGVWLLGLFQVLRRAMNYALSRPAREVLFTVLRREDKYKAKSFIDTFVYRAGDQMGAWSYPLMTWLGLGLTGISLAALPLAAGWTALSLWLGRRQIALAKLRRPDLA